MASNGMCSTRQMPDAYIIPSGANANRQLATIFVPNKYGSNCRWYLYIDQIDSSMLLGNGTVGPHGTAETIEYKRPHNNGRVLILLIVDQNKNIADIVKKNAGPTTSLAKQLFIKYFGVIVGGLVGMLASIFAYMYQEYIKDRKKKNALLNMFFGRLIFAIKHLRENWYSTRRAPQLSFINDEVLMNSILGYIQNNEFYEMIFKIIRLHNLWLNSNPVDDKKNGIDSSQLDEIEAILSSLLKKLKL